MKIKKRKKNDRLAFFGRQGNLVFSKRQKDLVRKHGTPADFAKACYSAVPGDISMDEARKAIEDYNREWEKAA